MDALMDALSGLLLFVIYFGIGLALLLAFKYLYAMVTPYDEWALVKENNVAAAAAIVGAAVGFSLALGSAASNSVSIIDFCIWAVVALIAQLLAFAIIRVLFLPKIVQRIKDGETAAGVALGGMSVAVGILHAACMTY